MRYTVHKTGTFAIKFGEGGKCGMGKRKFAFNFSVTAEKVDSRGFVLDHFEVEDQLAVEFNGKVYNGSCEELAVTVGQIINRYVKGARITEIVVRLTGADSKSGASVEVSGATIDFVNGKGVQAIQ